MIRIIKFTNFQLFAVFLFLLIAFSQISPNIALGGEASTQPASSNPASAPVKLTNPLTGNQSSKPIPEFLGQIINYVMGIIGSLALVMFIYGGATWMLSAGNEQTVEKGKSIVIWAALGIVLIFMSYAIVYFVINTIGGSTATAPNVNFGM